MQPSGLVHRSCAIHRKSTEIAHVQRVEAVPMQVNPAAAALYIVHPFRGQGIQSMFSTHPPLEDRIRRLHEYDSARGLHYA